MDDPNSGLTAFTSTDHSDETLDRNLGWGPWRLRGALGVANNVTACIYLLLLIFFSFWPSQLGINDPAQMNWAVVVTAGVALFSIGYYLLYAKKSYAGPVVEVDPHAL